MPGRLSALAVVFSAIFFAVLWRLDFPKPTYDDLFFVGAALNLSEGGDLSNPLIEGQQFPSHYYFAHPPFYSYALSLWLKLFGLSAAAVLGFQAVLYLLISAATILFLRQFQPPAFLYFAVPLGVSAVFMPVGMRHDALAVALTMAGLFLACAKRGGVAIVFCGYLLLFTGGAVAPRLTIFAGLLVVYVLWRQWRESRLSPETRSMVALLTPPVCALILVVVMFLWLIQFRVAEFWETFHLCMGRLKGSKLHSLRTFLFSGFSQCLMWVAAGVLLLRHALNPQRELLGLGLVLLLSFIVLTLIGGLGPGASWFAALVVFVLFSPVFRRVAAWERTGLVVMLAAALLLANSKLAANVFGITAGRIVTPILAKDVQMANTKESASGHTMVDGSVARYSFGFKLPRNCRDVEYAAPFPEGLPTLSELNGNEVMLIGPQTVEYLAGRGYPLKPTAKKWAFLGIRRWEFFVDPSDVTVVDVNSLRSVTAQAELDGATAK